MFKENYAKYYDLFNHDKPYKKEIEFVYKWAKKPKSILDIGCGTGNYWKFFPKKTQMVGIEKSPSMAMRNDLNCGVWCGDVTNFSFDTSEKFDCATALFDVMNYMPVHDWWANLPIKKGGYFIFDIFDAKKVYKEGFSKTYKVVKSATRIISPVHRNGKTLKWLFPSDKISLKIEVFHRGNYFQEKHKLYIYSHNDIEKFCGKDFEIVQVKPTKKWQTWYKLKRK